MLLAHKITVMERRLTNPSSGRISNQHHKFTKMQEGGHCCVQ
jgi:hypothetical protein